MNLLTQLSLRSSQGAGVHFVVESPKGSNIKYAYNQDIQSFVWSRPLAMGVRFPFDFGFLPQTIGGDGDALDGMLLTDQGSYPGIVVSSRVIGALRIEQKRDGQPSKRNDRIMLLPVHEHRQGTIHDISQFSIRVREEIEAFCHHSLVLTGKKISICGWAGAKEAHSIVADAERCFTT